VNENARQYTLSDVITRPMRHWFGQGTFFVAPLMAGNRAVGVLYADGRPSGRALRHEQFVAFPATWVRRRAGPWRRWHDGEAARLRRGG